MQNRNMPNNNNDLIAYCAGLFDGEGSINYAKYKCKKPNGKIDLDCIKNFYDIVGVGSIHFKGIGKGSLGKKDQWRWRCSHQKALYLARLFLPYSTVKRPKLLAIINHYEFVKPKETLGKKFSFLKPKKT